ncbi:replicative DNA helicase [Haemophilus parahaemolyticus]|uniref:YcgL domain-containing protein NCTC10794_01342 n=2 Tax=Haemophilus parahaemolyticus TaxID=735 RepID=A0A377I1R7_HAEPH|nr:replicative DNA helicase [Haemophilus parahaemolyticus]
MGKTTFAMNLCENAALSDVDDPNDLDENGIPKKKPAKPVLIFSLEMPRDQIMMRMLASLSRVDQTKIRTGQLHDDEDWAKLSTTISILQDRKNIFIDDSSGLTPTEVRSRARRVYKENGGLSLIMVDYLQLMRAPAFSDNRTLEIAEISRSLKALAKELQVPVVALSQLNRSLEQRADKRPVNSDLRESGSIEQDADLIMFIYRDEVYNDNPEHKGIAEIIIGKQRNGPIGKVRLTFQGQFSRFDNYTGGGDWMEQNKMSKANLCAIYRSPRKDGMFLYVAKRDQFDAVPEALMQQFGKPQFVMLFNLVGEKPLKRAKNKDVLQAIEQQGFYLQMPPPSENLLKVFLAERTQTYR